MEYITPHGYALLQENCELRLASVLVLDGGDIRWKRVCMSGAMVR